MDPRMRHAREIQERIRQVLLHDWDPIGVKDIPEADDEYDGYVGGVYRLLARRATAQEVVEHLLEMETKNMGLSSGLDGSEHLEHVAAELLALDVALGDHG